MDKWRPEGWDSLQAVKQIPTRQLQSNSAHEMLQEVFEAGADYMLEALKEKGAWMTPEQMKLLAPDRQYPYGYLVFIPEECKTPDRTPKRVECLACGREFWNTEFVTGHQGAHCPFCGKHKWKLKNSG